MSRTRLLLAVAAAAAVAVAAVAAAVEAPHDASSGYACSNCHLIHNSLGTSLTKNSVNSALCDSCHSTQTGFGFPFTSSEQSQAGVAGSHHNWSAAAANSAVGAVAPDPNSTDTVVAAMGHHLDGGTKLKCSTCHDVHQADANGGTQHTSVALATNVARTAGTGTGTLQLTSVAGTAVAKGYVIKLATATTFLISHDNGLSWFGYSGSTWSAGTATGKTFASGTAVTLDDTAVSVTFTGTFVAGDTFKNFYVSYPMLRGEGGRMCTSCHQARNMTYQNVEGSGTVAGTLQPVLLSTTVFSHPVNQGLGANGGGYDPANSSSILDADGSLQSAGDGNKTNDLTLNAAGNVSCLTCHYPHNADSNSLTVDPR